MLNYLADVHHIRFEKAKRRRAVTLAAAAGTSVHASAKVFSFIHINSEQYIKSGLDNRLDRKGKYTLIVTTATGSP